MKKPRRYRINLLAVLPLVVLFSTCKMPLLKSVQDSIERSHGITGFAVEAKNKSVELSWEDLPGITSYRAIDIDSGQEYTGISNPFTWENLENGELHTFQITAVVEDGSEVFSPHVSGLAISKRTLAPWINRIDYRSITIEWYPLPDGSPCVIQRRTGSDGYWDTITASSGRTYRDENLEHDTWYYYRLFPQGYPNLYSDPIAAVPGRFGRESFTQSTKDIAMNVVVEGDYAYVACDEAGLAVINVSDPSRPGSPIYIDTEGAALDVAVSGGKAYVACNEAGLAVIDIENPSDEPTYVPIPGNAVNVDANGTYVCVAVSKFDQASRARAGHLLVLDETTLNQSYSVRFYIYNSPLFYHTRDVDIHENIAYIAVSEAGLARIDLTQYSWGSENNVVDFYAIGMEEPGLALGVAVSDKAVCVTDYSGGLALFDPSSTEAPEFIQNVETEGHSMNVAIEGDTAYVADGDMGVAVIDIANLNDPGNPCYTATHDSAMGIDISGEGIFVADYYGGLTVVSETIPTETSYVISRFPNIPGSIFSITCAGDRALMGQSKRIGKDNWAFSKELHWVVLDITNPASPQIEPVGVITGVFEGDLEDFCRDGKPYISGDFAYVPNGAEGVCVLDISDPRAPSLLAKTPVPGVCYDIAVCGQYLYTASGNSGMHILDISDPHSPIHLGWFDTWGKAMSIEVTNDYAYIADDEAGLAAIEISDPRNPGFPAYTRHNNASLSVAVQGKRAFLSQADGVGLMTVNITDPTTPDPNPSYEGFHSEEWNYDVDIHGQYAFVAVTEYGMGICDITDPENILEIPKFDIGGRIENLSIHGSYAYICEQYRGLVIADLSQD